MSGVLSTLVVAGVLLCCGAAPALAVNCPEVIFVAVARDGTVSVNGQVAAPDLLDGTLSALKPSAKAIKYYRENGGGEPNAAQDARIETVLNAMMALRLPIGFSSKPDFSDLVGADGRSRPKAACEA